MQHVLHIINGEHYAGAERVQDILASRLPDLGYTVTFACLCQGVFSVERQSKSTPLHHVLMRNRLDLRPVYYLTRLANRLRVDLIHTHTPRSALIGSCLSALTGIPMVHHLHSPSTRESTNAFSNRLNTYLERIVLRRAQVVFCVSSSLRLHAATLGIRSSRVVLAANGVPSPGILSPRPAPHDTWSLGMIAMFRPRKGLETLFQALKILVDAGSDVRLLAVGPFETTAYQQHVQTTAEQLGLSERIEWLGFRRDISAQLSRMDLLIIPSLFGEGMPMVLLEAMAAGVPVVASSVEGIPEVIRNLQDGVLVPPGDVSALADGIGQYLHGRIDWRVIRDSAYHRQAEHYSDDSMTRSVASAYASIITNASTGLEG